MTAPWRLDPDPLHYSEEDAVDDALLEESIRRQGNRPLSSYPSLDEIEPAPSRFGAIFIIAALVVLVTLAVVLLAGRA